jgi:hypothetical protein
MVPCAFVKTRHDPLINRDCNNGRRCNGLEVHQHVFSVCIEIEQVELLCRTASNLRLVQRLRLRQWSARSVDAPHLTYISLAYTCARQPFDA